MSTVSRSNSFFETICPMWFGKTPELTKLEDTANDDWVNVSLSKRDKNGRICTDYLSPKEFVYTLERSTGDLYGISNYVITPVGERLKGPDGRPMIVIDSREIVATKSVAIFMGTPFYLFGMVFVNMVKIAVDLSAIFWRTIPQMIEDFKNKGVLASIGNLAMDLVWNIPHEVGQDIWQVVRSPLFAAGMMLAAGYGVIQPYEGRKWMGAIELSWHQGTTYHQDLRYDRSEKDYEKVPFTQMVKEIWSGKVYYLAYCMQKRGNIADKVSGGSRFHVFEKEPKKTDITSSPLEGGGTRYLFEVEYNGNTQSIEIEKRGDVAWPRRFKLVFSEMPNEACIKQFVEDVKTGLGTDKFPAGSIEYFLGNFMASRYTSKAIHETKDTDQGKLHTLSVRYNSILQKIEFLEKQDGTFLVESYDLKPDKFPSLDAREQFIEELQEILSGKNLWVKPRDKNGLQQAFQDGQMGRLVNLQYQWMNR